MARPRSRKKARNPSSKVTVRRADKAHKFRPCFSGVSKLIQEAWVKDDTLVSNYRKMGLVSSLEGLKGGVQTKRVVQRTTNLPLDEADPSFEQPNQSRFKGFVGVVDLEEYDKMKADEAVETAHSDSSDDEGKNPLEMPDMEELEERVPMEARVLRIGSCIAKRDEPENASEFFVEEELSHKTNAQIRAEERNRRLNKAQEFNAAKFISMLEELARTEAKKKRWQSQQEINWIIGCISKHSQDYRMMARDKKLNPFQMTPKQIQKKMEKFLAAANECSLPRWVSLQV